MPLGVLALASSEHPSLEHSNESRLCPGCSLGIVAMKNDTSSVNRQPRLHGTTPISLSSEVTCSACRVLCNYTSSSVQTTHLIYLAAFAIVFRALPFLNHSIWPALKVCESSQSHSFPSWGCTFIVMGFPTASSVAMMSTLSSGLILS